MTRTAQDIRTGFEVFATISLDTDSPLLDASNATTPLPDVSGAVIRKSVAGNADGFASNIPHIDVYVINTSAIRIVIVSTPPYDIAEDEGLTCLLYTSDAADEEDSVDLGGRRIIKKTKAKNGID
eukprot:TRINITY_DN38787_c0_g2_i1.p1 TRINITY_DN38787_c0_g2~~TRINITY_DN38787_c0_g2_i1.p1  ORF type:complete len:125 (-),score=18.07 TRINITY_DN38787_c0_g2_i1:110-484(-)